MNQYKEIFKELKEMSESLSKGWKSSPSEQTEYLHLLAILKARINELKADAEEQNLDALEAFKKSMEEKKDIKNYLYNDEKAVFCKEQIHLKTYIDRVSSTINFQFEALRSVLSFTKAEIQSSFYIKD